VHAARFHGSRLSHRDTFYASLICNVPVGCRLLTCFDDEDGAVFSWVRCAAVTAMTSSPPSASTYPVARFIQCTLPCLPLKSTAHAPLKPHLLAVLHQAAEPLLEAVPHAVAGCFRHGASAAAGSRDSESAIERCAQPQLGPSRHPDIEAFITSICTTVGCSHAPPLLSSLVISAALCICYQARGITCIKLH